MALSASYLISVAIIISSMVLRSFGNIWGYPASNGKGRRNGRRQQNDVGNSDSVDSDNSNDTATNTNTDCNSTCFDGVRIPDFCSYASYQYDHLSVPLNERNNIGRASLLSSAHIFKANSLVKIGKVYELVYSKTNVMPALFERTWHTSLRYPVPPSGDISEYYRFTSLPDDEQQCGSGFSALEQRLLTSASGNSGSQFDGLGHFFYMNGPNGDTKNYLFHNGFTGVDVMREYGVDYIGVDQLPPFITRAILLDVAGFVGQDPLPVSTQIDAEMIENVLLYQGMSVDYIEEGDVILIYTGYTGANWFDNVDGYYGDSPGLVLDTIIDIFGPKGVLLLGADNWAVEYVQFPTALSFPVHVHWIICNGGFLFENMRLDHWVTDARNGSVPYQGGFYFAHTKIKGAVGGMGTPIVIV